MPINKNGILNKEDKVVIIHDDFVLPNKDRNRTKQYFNKKGRYHQGVFEPINKKKCLNYRYHLDISYRSSWEQKFYAYLDNTNSIIAWGVEIFQILYYDPIRQKQGIYVPDVYFEYIGVDKKIHRVMAEIKPKKEADITKASNGYDKLAYARNMCKWKSAIEYCKKRNIEFKVLTEDELL